VSEISSDTGHLRRHRIYTVTQALRAKTLSFSRFSGVERRMNQEALISSPLKITVLIHACPVASENGTGVIRVIRAKNSSFSLL